MMARRPLNSKETDLETLEKIERGECHGRVKPCTVNGISIKAEINRRWPEDPLTE
jgi:hypothetical protein